MPAAHKPRLTVARLALVTMSVPVTACLSATIAALLAGSPRIATCMFGVAVSLAAGPIVVLAASRRGRLLATCVTTTGLALAIPWIAPAPPAPSEGFVVSHHLDGKTRGLWFGRLPEREWIRLGARFGLLPEERLSWLRLGDGNLLGPLEDFEPGDVLESTTNLAVDGWLVDRGHYWLGVPDEPPDTASGYPLAVFLHGHGGNFQVYPWLWARPAQLRRVAIAFPTLGFGHWDTAPAWSRVQRVVRDAASKAAIDTGRVALVGLSSGGRGAVRVAAANPGAYRLAVAISSPVDPRVPLTELRTTPTLFVHGTRDARAPIQATRDLVDALRQCGARAVLESVDATHLLMLEDTDVVDRVLDAVVDELR